MKFTIDQKAFQNALEALITVIPDKPTQPILSGVFLDVGENVELAATNLETRVELEVETEVEESGTAVIPCKVLLGLIKQMTGVISVSTEEDTVVVSSKNASYKLRTWNEENFPQSWDLTIKEAVAVDHNFVQKIDDVRFAVASDPSKHFLTGVHVKVFNGGFYEVAGVDGHRMAIHRSEYDSPNHELTIPASGAVTLTTLVKKLGTPEKFELQIAENTLVVCSGQNRFLQRLILDNGEDNYPPYRQLIAGYKFSTEIVIDKALLVEALERIAVVVDTQKKFVKILTFNHQIKITISSSTVGEAVEQISADCTNEGLFGFDAKYLAEIKRFSGQTVTIKLNSEICIATSDNPNDFQYLVALSRVSDN